MAEFPLYVKTYALVSHILTKYTNNESQDYMIDFPKAIKSLWIDLYEYGFVEIEDVNTIALWLKALSSVGYQFPSKIKSGEAAENSKENLELFPSGNNIYDLGKMYRANYYKGSTYLKDRCIKNNAGKNKHFLKACVRNIVY
jgi:hypothetical protein